MDKILIGIAILVCVFMLWRYFSWRSHTNCVTRAASLSTTKRMTLPLFGICWGIAIVSMIFVKNKSFMFIVAMLVLFVAPMAPMLFSSFSKQARQDSRDVTKGALHVTAASSAFIGGLIGLAGLAIGGVGALVTVPLGALIGYLIGKSYQKTIKACADNINSKVDLYDTVDQKKLDKALDLIVDPSGKTSVSSVASKDKIESNDIQGLNKAYYDNMRDALNSYGIDTSNIPDNQLAACALKIGSSSKLQELRDSGMKEVDIPFALLNVKR